MRWNKGSSTNFTLRIPGELPVRAMIVAHSETIVISLMIGGETIRKWGIPVSMGIEEAKAQVEKMLNGLAQGIWES